MSKDDKTDRQGDSKYPSDRTLTRSQQPTGPVEFSSQPSRPKEIRMEAAPPKPSEDR